MSMEALNKFSSLIRGRLLTSILHVMQFLGRAASGLPKSKLNCSRAFSKANRISEAPFLKLQAMMYAVIAMKAVAANVNHRMKG